MNKLLKINYFIIHFLIIQVLTSCTHTNKIISAENLGNENFFLAVSIDGISFNEITDSESIVLSSDRLIIQTKIGNYLQKDGGFRSLQIAALTDEKMFSEFKAGTQIAQTSYFEPGTGMAPDGSGIYNSLMVGNFGHHYLIHDEGKETRFNQVEKLNDGLYLASWVIKNIELNGVEYKIADLPKNSRIFLIGLMNFNGDEVVDKNEFVKCILTN